MRGRHFAIGAALAISFATSHGWAGNVPATPAAPQLQEQHEVVERAPAWTPPKAPSGFGGRLVATVESPVARHVVAESLKPVPHAVANHMEQWWKGSRGAAEKIEKLEDGELRQMNAVDMAHLAAPAARPNVFQGISASQKARLSTAFFRVLDTAAAQSPGKLDAVLANMRLTEHVVPNRFNLEKLGATSRFQQLVADNRIARGDLHAFDQRLADMGMKRGDGSLHYFVDGQAAFGDVHSTMMTALDEAKRTGKPGFVLISTFALHSDQTGRDVAADLVALKNAGFDVHVLYDSVGSKKSNGTWSDPHFYESLKSAGIDLTPVKASAMAMHLSHKKPIQIGYHTAEGPKLVEYNGDMNIGDPYRKFWHGSMSRIEGPATKATMGALLDQMKANGAHITPDDESRYRAVADAQTSKPGMSPIWTINHEGPKDLYNKMTTLSIVNVAPKGGHIFVEQPYVDDPDFFAALERAAKDGVNVHLIVPQHNDQPTVASATREQYKTLVASGVHVHEFDNPRFKNPEGFSHLKRIVVLDAKGEGLISQDGSTNSDAQSFYHNDELVHVLTTGGIKDEALRAQKSDLIKGIARDVFFRDIRASRTVTAAMEPKPSFSEDLRKLANSWHVMGWIE